jgi:anti-sigma B factor antagonist
MSDLAMVEAERDGTQLRVRVAGEIDISNARDVGGTIERAVPADVGGVVIDLAEITYLDSSGISLLLRLEERLRARRIDMRLAVPAGAPVRAALEFTGLGRLMQPAE